VSIDLLILFVIFVLVPLIERMLREAQQRGQPTPGDTSRQPQKAAPPRTRPPVPVPVPAPVPTSMPEPQPVLSLPVSTAEKRQVDPRPDRGTGKPVVRTLTPRSMTRAGTVVSLRTRPDLRRAMALTAILGPCRADQPYEWPADAGRP
jgi:hypothetical protein